MIIRSHYFACFMLQKRVRKIDEARECLEQMLSLAENAGLAKWQAHAFWRLGELMVRGGRPATGAPLLMHAYGCFGGTEGGLTVRHK